MAINQEQEEFLAVLQERFAGNMQRHPGISWDDVRTKLAAMPEKLLILQQMELTGGEPDVVVFAAGDPDLIFCDCAEQSPAGRYSLCYDAAALAARKKNKPEGDAQSMAESIGIEMLTEEQYRKLQELGAYDTKTSSWLQTPDKIRALGGAIFGDRRFDTVFIYHNGADSYYSGRGFRGLLRLP